MRPKKTFSVFDCSSHAGTEERSGRAGTCAFGTVQIRIVSTRLWVHTIRICTVPNAQVPARPLLSLPLVEEELSSESKVSDKSIHGESIFTLFFLPDLLLPGNIMMRE